MSNVLVVGASGQLGTAIVDQLVKNGVDCVALLRPSSRFDLEAHSQVKVVYGDLSDLHSLCLACKGITHVIATASAIVPRKGDRFGKDEVEYYRNLIKACKQNLVDHIIYISAFTSNYDYLVPEFRIKREIEEIILASELPYTIFRVAPFMDIYYAVIGSDLAINGVKNPTLLRGFWLTNLYTKLTCGIIEKYGIALLPGNGRTCHSFICVEDVAKFAVKATMLPSSMNRIIELGGPEAVSWLDVVNIYADVLDKKIKVVNVPGMLLTFFEKFLSFVSPAGENIMSIIGLLGRYSFPIDMNAISKEFDISLSDTRSFVKSKLSHK